MQSMVLTVVGKDKVGLINQLSECVETSGGNWLESSFCHLAGQFAGFIEVQLTDDNCEKLIANCEKIEDLKITLVQSGESSAESQNTLRLTVTGNDRTGIVKDITSTLKRFNASIEEMQTHCQSAPNWGSLIFTAEIVLSCSSALDATELKDAIEQIADDLMVEIEKG